MNMIKRFLRSREVFSLVFIIALFLAVGIINPTFLSPSNLSLSFNGSVVYVLVSVGIAFVILTGEIDVSIGAILGLSASVAATLLRDGSSWIVAIGVALIIGAVIGLINGLGVVLLKIPSIIMTLGTNSVVRGLIYVYSGGKWVENLPFKYKALSQISVIGNLSLFFVSTIVLVSVLYFYLTKTKGGKYFSAIGDNMDGATLIGIPVIRTKILAYVICGIFAALGALVYVSRVGFVTPTAGGGYEMIAIAACVLGGISLSGGVGSVLGAAVGALIMSSISRILVFLKFSSDYDNTITGVLLITIVVFDALIQRRMIEKARRERLAAKTGMNTQSALDQ